MAGTCEIQVSFHLRGSKDSPSELRLTGPSSKKVPRKKTKGETLFIGGTQPFNVRFLGSDAELNILRYKDKYQ